MKFKKHITISIIVLCLVSLIALPIETKAKTISQFQSEVNTYTAELQAKKDKLAKNETEVAQIKSKIASIEKQISDAQAEIESLEKQIDESNKEIEKKSEESKAIMEYYQVSNGDNIYLEYVFGASDITDMIYRMSIVEQLTEYNDKIMKELKELIAKNEKRQKELETKKVELDQLQKDLQDQKERIDADSTKLKEAMPSLEEQIKAAKANLNYYKSLGCGANEDIQSCQYRVQQSSGSGSVPSANGTYRPMESGYVVRGLSSSHVGYDFSDSNKSITIYPIASGQLYYVGYDSAGALIVVIRHNIGGRYIYATYCHMRSFSSAVSGYINYTKGTSASITNGPIISAFTPLGQMGSTGNSTGPHLHLEVSTCQWHKGGGCTYKQYLNNIQNPGNYFTIVSRWNNR